MQSSLPVKWSHLVILPPHRQLEGLGRERRVDAERQVCHRQVVRTHP